MERMSSDHVRQPITSIQLGDKVAYSKRFLQNTGQFTGEAPFARGNVAGFTRLGDLVLARIQWDRPGPPDRVNVRNLSRIVDGRVIDLE